MLYEENVSLVINSLFEKKKQYSKMININDEIINNLQELIPQFEEVFKQNTKTLYVPDKRYIRYLNCVKFLLHNYKAKLLSFDEKMMFLILACDPDCIILKKYEEAHIMTKEKVLSAEVYEEKKYLNDVRNKQIENLKSDVRKEIGFFEAELITYERDYTNRILKKTEFNIDVKKDYSQFLLKSLVQNNITKISDEDFDRVKKIAMYYLSCINGNIDHKILSNSIIYQNDLLHLKNTTEKVIFFILVIDPTLEAFKIYEDNCNLHVIKDLMIDKIGFYNRDLITLEKNYHSLYCPDMFISEWTLKKDL